MLVFRLVLQFEKVPTDRMGRPITKKKLFETIEIAFMDNLVKRIEKSESYEKCKSKIYTHRSSIINIPHNDGL
ncbi:hypothetical protein DFO77_1227 [Marinilabilia salmonicolor]|uniref:Uncharacterized protein n=1 Tax=Marinilabilia salmonicolor TaxID=989 RepID=A0A368UNJ0_9BACT|nr:hypothetical protein DFO77_1227 [Marinilabilia salmonicolor]